MSKSVDRGARSDKPWRDKDRRRVAGMSHNVRERVLGRQGPDETVIFNKHLPKTERRRRSRLFGSRSSQQS